MHVIFWMKKTVKSKNLIVKRFCKQKNALGLFNVTFELIMSSILWWMLVKCKKFVAYSNLLLCLNA